MTELGLAGVASAKPLLVEGELETDSRPPVPPAVASTSLGPRARRTLSAVATVSATLGLLVAAFALYLFGFTGLEAYRTQHQLTEQLEGSAGLDALNGRTPPEGQPVAVLQIPALGLRQVVVEGTSAKDLEEGPGLMIGSAPPGTSGDVVVAGRRSTFGAPFGSLDRLRTHDVVVLTGALGTFRYQVESLERVRPGTPLPIGPTTSAEVSLVTAGSTFGEGSLLVARARLIGRPVAVLPLKDASDPSGDFGLAGDSSAAAPAVLWSGLLLGTLAFAWYLRRRTGRPWLVYVMTAPVAIALALLAFANVAALLPATL